MLAVLPSCVYERFYLFKSLDCRLNIIAAVVFNGLLRDYGF